MLNFGLLNKTSPCCRFVIFNERTNGKYGIFPVFFREDEPLKIDDKTYEGGANRVSLLQAGKKSIWGIGYRLYA
ncbi:MAG: hypothetical protein HFJ09_12240 [Lachnospiraceae bacterium]|nr:hypothetical protein [Lachnospiraceae bacterium]